MSETATNEEPRFTWDLGDAEHLAVHRAVFRNSRGRWIFTALAAVGVIYVVGSFLLGLRGGRSAGSLSGELVPWAFMAVFWAVLMPPALARSAVKAQKEVHSGPRWLVLGATAAETGCDTCATKLAWPSFKRAVETRDTFLLFYNPDCAFYLPKRVLASRAEEERFRAVVRQRMPGATLTGFPT